MVYKNTRPDSPKGQCYQVFYHDGGEAAMMKFGKSLGLPESKLKRWLIEFGPGEDPGGSGERFGIPPAPQPKRSKGNGSIPRVARKGNYKGKRVRLVYKPTRKGTITEAGPEQSLVKWDDGWPQAIIPNDQLEPLK